MGNLTRRDVSESMNSRDITVAVLDFCKGRGLHPATVRAKAHLFSCAIREYYQKLRYSDRRPLGRPLDVETLVDLMDRAECD
jgi:hypothetical protein